MRRWLKTAAWAALLLITAIVAAAYLYLRVIAVMFASEPATGTFVDVSAPNELRAMHAAVLRPDARRRCPSGAKRTRP